MTRPKDISTTATSAAGDDYMVLDGATNGSRKILASNVGGGLVLIESYTGTGSTGTKTFSSIPSTYTDLVLEITGRCSAASTAVDLAITVNGLGGTNYDDQRIFAQSTSVGGDQHIASASWPQCFALPGSTVTSTFVGGGRMTIFNYAGTSIGKVMESTSHQINNTTSGNAYQLRVTGQVRTTSAISSLTCTLASGNFTTDTLIRLYGRI